MRYTYIFIVDEDGNYVIDSQGRFVIAGYRQSGVFTGRKTLLSRRRSLLTARGRVIASGPQLPTFEDGYLLSEDGFALLTEDGGHLLLG